jgi:N-methylhydantoinase A
MVPQDPGLLSAYGMLAADVIRQTARTVLIQGGDPEADVRIGGVLDALETAAVEDMVEQGTAKEAVSTERWIDVRYRGQSFELRVPAAGWRDKFHAAHEMRYGYQRREAPLEAVTLRVTARAPGPRLDHVPIATADGPPPTEAGRAYHDGEWIETRRVWREDLGAGHRLDGPLQVLEYSATTWVPPGWVLDVDRWGSLHLSRSD